jgi:hypothetical protein
MKKILMLTGLLLAVVSGVFGQANVAGKTYYYKYVNTVEDGTGVRTKDSTKDMYITFTSNSCYESDKEGNKSGKVYSYKTKENSAIQYLFHDKKVSKKTGYTQGEMYVPGYSTMFGYSPGYSIPMPQPYEYEETDYDVYYYLTFSEDFKTLNRQEYYEKHSYSSQKNKTWDKNIYVYNQSSPPAPPAPPKGPEGPKKMIY